MDNLELNKILTELTKVAANVETKGRNKKALEGLRQASDVSELNIVFRKCIDRAVKDNRNVVSGCRSIMSQMVKTASEMIELVDRDDLGLNDTQRVIVEMLLDYGLAKASEQCIEKIEEEIG